jgi:hypothetical protein
VPEGVELGVELPPQLEGDERHPVQVRVMSTADMDGLAEVRLVVRSVEGPQAVVRIPLQVASARPRLVFEPGELRAGELRGGQTILPVTVRNVGGRSSGPLALALPPVDWFGVAESVPLPGMAPGEARQIHLVIRAPLDLPLGEQRGTLAISDGLASATLPFSLAILSDSLGTLEVEVVDEYTYYAEGAPRVAGAKVKAVRQDGTGASVEGVADALGRVRFEGLREGWYEVTGTADRHRPGREPVLLRSGPPTPALLFLPRTTVEYFFTVEEVALEERTRVRIETVFETAVPIPVVTVEPALIDLDEVVQDRTEIEFTITNHGLISANELRLFFSNSAGWRFTVLQSELGDLPARSSVTVPVVLERLTGARGAGLAAGGGCPSGGAQWTLQCGGSNRGYGAGIGMSGGGTGGCGGSGGVRGATGSGGGTVHSVTGSAAGSCDPCTDDMAGALLDCAIACAIWRSPPTISSVGRANRIWQTCGSRG